MEGYIKFINRIKSYILSIYFFDLLFKAPNKNEKFPVIHVIGDSHTSVFSGENIMLKEWPNKVRNTIPIFKCYRIGAPTAYNSEKRLPVIRKILHFRSSNFIKEKDFIMLCFGEIDIRVHLLKQSIMKHKSIEEIVNECVNRYFKLIKILANDGYKLIIYGPIASSNFNVRIDNYNSFGSVKVRNTITQLFSDQLEDKCNIMNIPFISIFKELINNENKTKMEYYMDDIHLSNKALPLILKKLESHGIVNF